MYRTDIQSDGVGNFVINGKSLPSILKVNPFLISVYPIKNSTDAEKKLVTNIPVMCRSNGLAINRR